VQCDNNCDCVPTRKQDILPIRVEIRYPSVESAVTNAIYGYHRNAISVRQVGREGVCSKDSLLTQWCEHDEGNAEFYNGLTLDSGYETSTTESIVIPDAHGNYWFRVEHDIPEDSVDYVNLSDRRTTGTVHLWINGVESEYTHEINGSYYDTFDLKVECNGDSSSCVINQQIGCEINARLQFPKKSNTAYYGYNNNDMSVTKEIEAGGNETDVCGPVDGVKEGGETSWNCIHEGDARVEKYEHTGSVTFQREEEYVTIRSALNGGFNFTSNHKYTVNDDETYNTDGYKIISTMSIWINGINDGELLGRFKEPVISSNVTGTDDPNFRNHFDVNVNCNAMCDCEAQYLG